MILPALLKRIARSRLRSTIRGYIFLKRSGSLGLVRNIKNDLASRDFSIRGCVASPRVFGTQADNAERIVRQYLLERLLDRAFNRSLLFANGRKSSVVYPLPPEWRSALTEYGFRVSMLSALLWWGYLSKHLLRGAYVFFDSAALHRCIQAFRAALWDPFLFSEIK